MIEASSRPALVGVFLVGLSSWLDYSWLDAFFGAFFAANKREKVKNKVSLWLGFSKL